MVGGALGLVALAAAAFVLVLHHDEGDAAPVADGRMKNGPLSDKTAPIPTGYAAFLPSALAGVTHGMDLHALRGIRPRVTRHQAADRGGDLAYQEPLGESSRALYFFSEKGTLSGMQLVSKLAGTSAIAPRVMEMTRRGASTPAVFDCGAASGELPTRRYAWRLGDIMAVDVFVVLGDRVAATLSLSDSATLTTSLAAAGCLPVGDERMTLFPAASGGSQRSRSSNATE